MPAPDTTWTPVKIGAVTYRSEREAAKWYLRHSKLSQSAIARKVGCSAPCVCQCAGEMREAGILRPGEKPSKRRKRK